MTSLFRVKRDICKVSQTAPCLTRPYYLEFETVFLESWIHEKGLTIVGDPIWARYDPPFTPWFLRRNEILIPVDTGTD